MNLEQCEAMWFAWLLWQPEDRGDASKYGVTAAYAEEWLADVPVAQITLDMAFWAYHEGIWGPQGARAQEVWEHSPPIAVLYADAAVLSGPHAAVQTLQRTLNDIPLAAPRGHPSTLVEDGVLGPLTLDALEETVAQEPKPWLVAAWARKRLGWLTALAQEHPSQKRFHAGRQARLLSAVELADSVGAAGRNKTFTPEL